MGFEEPRVGLWSISACKTRVLNAKHKRWMQNMLAVAVLGGEPS